MKEGNVLRRIKSLVCNSMEDNLYPAAGEITLWWSMVFTKCPPYEIVSVSGKKVKMHELSGSYKKAHVLGVKAPLPLLREVVENILRGGRGLLKF